MSQLWLGQLRQERAGWIKQRSSQSIGSGVGTAGIACQVAQNSGYTSVVYCGQEVTQLNRIGEQSECKHDIDQASKWQLQAYQKHPIQCSPSVLKSRSTCFQNDEDEQCTKYLLESLRGRAATSKQPKHDLDGLELATWEQEQAASRSSLDTRLKVKGSRGTAHSPGPDGWSLAIPGTTKEIPSNEWRWTVCTRTTSSMGIDNTTTNDQPW